MISPEALIKFAGADGRLVPYFKSLVVYVMVWGFYSNPSARVVAKVLPVACLGVALRRHIKHCPKGSSQRNLCEYLSIGLFLSACGDALLEWGLFEPGMAAFAAAQGCYWTAWGPQAWLIPRLVVAACALWFSIWLNAPGILQTLVPLYGLVLSLTVGRGVARYSHSWHAKAGALGSAMFGVSDSLLGYAMFRAPLRHRTAWVMGTYYAAQYGIALAAFEPLVPARP